MIGLLTKFIPLKWPIIGIGFLLFLMGAFFYGVSVGKAKENAKLLAAVEDARAEEQALQAEQRRALDDYYNELIARNVKREVVEKEVLRYVETPAADVDCLDDDGVRVIERILDSEVSGTSGVVGNSR